ncbi:hypothetical protein [Nocardiopsis sp. JB363]|uniref:hypothetical protein n=1 Tax=Nocardiopsis sp. JB363 TaxID=1434837 RepID=UPI00097AF426|nr:hypothetical protein [Nocardiopsis sp. JB363]SIO86468.1 hypothetical protein BQ8420_12155 [Nocardiopsis sp. JB363]
MRWNPCHLPSIRQQMAHLMNDPATPLYALLPEDRVEFASLAHQLSAADLYWLTPAMTDLSMSSGQKLPDVRWVESNSPSPHGLAVFDGGVGAVEFGGSQLPVDALSWGPSPKGLRLWQWVRRDWVEAMLGLGEGQAATWMPSLIPAQGNTLPVSCETTPTDKALRTVVAALVSAWTIMGQPHLVDRSQVYPDGEERRALALVEESVTLVDLHDRLVPQVRHARS